MTVARSLKSLSAYPIPSTTVQDIVEAVGLTVSEEATPEVRLSAAFRKAQALTLKYLSTAPNVSQGGQSYNFSEKERRWMRSQADDILDDLGELSGSIDEYGYQGEDL